MTGGGKPTPTQDKGGRSRPFLRWVAGLIALFETSGKIIAFVMLALTFLTLLTNVILRYAFGSGIAWAYEIHAVSLPWLVAGGIVIAAARSRNIAITLLPDMLNQTQHRALMLLVNLAIAVIAFSVLWSSQPILKASTFQKLSTLGIKQIWGYSSLVYAFGGMGLIAVFNAIHALSAQAEKSDPAHTSLS